VRQPSFFNVLELIEARPGIYLGWDPQHRREQLTGLQFILLGYRLALEQHSIGTDDLNMLDELEKFLRQRSGADNLHAIDQIIRTSSTPDDAWDRVWTLLNEFRTLHRVGQD